MNPMYNIRFRKDFTATEMVAIKRALEPLYKAKMGRPIKDKEPVKQDSGKTIPEEKKETTKDLHVPDKTLLEDKKVGSQKPTLGRTREIIAKSLGVSGSQLEKAETIVEASEKAGTFIS